MNAPTSLKEGEALTLDLEPQDTPRSLPAVQQQGAVALAAPDTSPASIMLKVLASGGTLEQVEKMMDLIERQEKRDAEKAYNADYAGFRGENIIIPKGKRVDRGRAGSFMQAEYDDVCRRLSPALSRHGFGFDHDVVFGSKPNPTPENPEAAIAWVTVTCFLRHRMGHSRQTFLEGPQDEQSANSAVQNMQSTATILKRQTLLNITGTATGGEDDEALQRRSADAAADRLYDDLIERLEKTATDKAAADLWAEGSQAIHNTGRADLYDDFKALVVKHRNHLKTRGGAR